MLNSILMILCLASVVLSAAGCHSLVQPVSETTVDQELIRYPSPSKPPSGADSDEPRTGFKQEPEDDSTP
jgi:hypothetical protein